MLAVCRSVCLSVCLSVWSVSLLIVIIDFLEFLSNVKNVVTDKGVKEERGMVERNSAMVAFLSVEEQL